MNRILLAATTPMVEQNRMPHADAARHFPFHDSHKPSNNAPGKVKLLSPRNVTHVGRISIFPVFLRALRALTD